MKHIRQSPQEHTTCSFNVTEDMTSFMPGADLRAVRCFPSRDQSKKGITLGYGIDFGYRQENLPEIPGIIGSGRHPAPGQPLTLDMDQTTLDSHFGPDILKRPDYMRVPINRETARLQSIKSQLCQEAPQLLRRVLRYSVLTGYELVIARIQQGHQALRTVQESAIENKMPELPPMYWRLGSRLFQVFVYHFIKLPCAVFALMHQLSDRVSFNYPQPKPLAFVMKTEPWAAPLVGAFT